jgi:hypothetical protein
MTKSYLRAGAVFRYSYLWHSEHLAGQPEASKERPVLALAVAVGDKDGRTHVLALPVTHSPPKLEHHGVRLPDATKRLLGLDELPSWVVTTESVRFAWPGHDVRTAPGRSSAVYGTISSALLRAVAQSYVSNRNTGEAVSFDRYD